MQQNFLKQGPRKAKTMARGWDVRTLLRGTGLQTTRIMTAPSGAGRGPLGRSSSEQLAKNGTFPSQLAQMSLKMPVLGPKSYDFGLGDEGSILLSTAAPPSNRRPDHARGRVARTVTAP